MSNHDNPRRGEEARTEHGSRWEGPDNSKCASRARAWWKNFRHRVERRTGFASKYHPTKPGRLSPLPSTETTDE